MQQKLKNYISSTLAETSSGTRILIITRKEISSTLEDFREFCTVDLQQKGNTAYRRIGHIRRLLFWFNGGVITREAIRKHLGTFRSMSTLTHKNVLCS